MTVETPKPNSSRMIALTGDPRIGVHVLTEFLFCSRAGLWAFEQNREDFGEDEPYLNLSYLPRYDVQLIEHQMERLWNRLWWIIAAIICLFALVAFWMLHYLDARFAWIFPAALPFAGWAAFKTLQQIGELNHRYRLATTATGREPVADSAEVQAVNWWELRQAGFRTKRYDALHDEHWNIAGRPWLVLFRDSLVIPVFRQHRPGDRLYRQHFARMAAYCHLIETCVGASSPYGIILRGDSYEGVAIPNSPASRKAFHDGLVEARHLVKESLRKCPAPEPPTRETHCLECPIGRPKNFQSGKSEFESRGGLLPVCPAKGRDERIYHSACGDRFGWIPPHRRALEKGLEPLVRRTNVLRRLVKTFFGQ